MKTLLKSLASVGESSEENLVKSSFGDVSVYFGLPIEVLKIETNPPQAAYAKICRLSQNALNVAYSTVQKAALDGKEPQDGVFTVSADGDLGVVIDRNMMILEMGFKNARSEEGDIEAFLRNVVIATNAGYLKAQINASELTKNFLQS